MSNIWPCIQCIRQWLQLQTGCSLGVCNLYSPSSALFSLNNSKSSMLSFFLLFKHYKQRSFSSCCQKVNLVFFWCTYVECMCVLLCIHPVYCRTASADRVCFNIHPMEWSRLVCCLFKFKDWVNMLWKRKGLHQISTALVNLGSFHYDMSFAWEYDTSSFLICFLPPIEIQQLQLMTVTRSTCSWGFQGLSG